MKIQLPHSFNDIICLENLALAWEEFIIGKKKKPDVQEFARNLMDNILALHEDLAKKKYQHGGYEDFFINDPNRRHIHKASVRDRLLHHAVYRKLYPFFDRTFIADSYSCRKKKGMHKALNRFRSFAYRASQNHKRTCWVLKCDIRKFFASIDHKILIRILDAYIPERNIIWLVNNIISSFSAGNQIGRGMPLGNLTSQLFTNVYMNEFDQFMKHKIKAKYYIRYADDFVILSDNRQWLEKIMLEMKDFLLFNLKLVMHKDKTFIKTLASGVDFLGWVHFSDHRVLRSTTRRRMLARISEHPSPETIASYLGLVKHGNTEKITPNLSQARTTVE